MLALRCNVDVVSEYYREGDAKFRGHKKTTRVGFLQIPQPCGPKSERDCFSLCGSFAGRFYVSCAKRYWTLG